MGCSSVLANQLLTVDARSSVYTSLPFELNHNSRGSKTLNNSISADLQSLYLQLAGNCTVYDGL
ncbi:hypothetical protein FD723_04095 [Nostoc sp. C052]|uniref:hypothetical protein n=1 Tax=unclassified Nostoc TaxID=2593658 RepID=UPI0015C387B2|nr:hypothetical protein [Nostoc sp. C052]QLE39741.1 hypothetical protein FD723_04095 [Nostoc sp. C052]